MTRRMFVGFQTGDISESQVSAGYGYGRVAVGTIRRWASNAFHHFTAGGSGSVSDDIWFGGLDAGQWYTPGTPLDLNDATVYTKIHCYFAAWAAPSSNTIIGRANYEASGFQTLWYLVCSDSGKISVWSENSIGSLTKRVESSSLVLNQVYCIEVAVTNSNVAAGASLELRVNGVVIGTVTGLTLSLGTGKVDTVHFQSGYVASVDSVLDWYITDIVFDTAGYPGPTTIIGLRPDGAGTWAQWVTGTGNTYTQINDSWSNPSDTTYIMHSAATAGQVSTFTLTDIPMPTKSIKAVSVIAKVGKNTGGSESFSNYKVCLEIGGVRYDGPSGTNPVIPTVINMLAGIWETNPATGIAWTLSDINSLAAGVVSDSADRMRVYALIVMVEVEMGSFVTWDMALASQVAKTVTWDAALATLVASSITWDAAIILNGTKTVTWDAALATLVTKTVTWDALLAARVAPTLTWDMALALLPFKTITWDLMSYVTQAKQLSWDMVLYDAIEPRGRVSIEVFDSSGTKLAFGILTNNQLTAKYQQRLDQVGAYVFSIPAADPRAAYLAQLQRVKIYKEGEGFVFYGIIEHIDTDRTKDDPTLVVSGSSVGRDLVRSKVHLSTIIPSEALSTATSALLAYASGWSAGSVDSGTFPGRRFDGVSVWAGLQKLAEMMLMHVRENPIAATIDVGAFGTNPNSVTLTNRLGSDFSSPDPQWLFRVAQIMPSSDSKELCNRVIPLGGGTGYGALTLEHASRPASNLCTNPSFESDGYLGDGLAATGWIGINATILAWETSIVDTNGLLTSDPTATAPHGFFMGYVHASGAGSFGGKCSTNISGSTQGRVYSARLIVLNYDSTPFLNSTSGTIRIREKGGATGDEDHDASFTFTAGQGYTTCEVSATINRNDRTSLELQVLATAAGAGVIFRMDAVVWQLKSLTNLDPHPMTLWNQNLYPIYYIEDASSIASYGAFASYQNLADIVAVTAGTVGWQAAANGLYDASLTYLKRHKLPQSMYKVVPSRLRHLDASGAYLFKPGDLIACDFKETIREVDGSDWRRWIDVAADLFLIGFDRTMNADGTDTWQLELAQYDYLVRDDSRLLASVNGSVSALTAVPTPGTTTVTFGPVNGSVAATALQLYVNADSVSVRLLHKATLHFLFVTGPDLITVKVNGVNMKDKYGADISSYGAPSEPIVDVTHLMVDGSGVLHAQNLIAISRTSGAGTEVIAGFSLTMVGIDAPQQGT